MYYNATAYSVAHIKIQNMHHILVRLSDSEIVGHMEGKSAEMTLTSSSGKYPGGESYNDTPMFH